MENTPPTTTTFHIPGPPVGKARPRVTRAGKAYTPPKTRQWEQAAATRCALLWRPGDPLQCPVSVQVLALHPRPRARPQQVTPEQWQAGQRIHRPCTPDLDNVIKACCDALQLAGVLEDDRQVVHLQAWSAWCAAGEKSCVEITISTTPPQPPAEATS